MRFGHVKPAVCASAALRVRMSPLILGKVERCRLAHARYCLPRTERPRLILRRMPRLSARTRCVACVGVRGHRLRARKDPGHQVPNEKQSDSGARPERTRAASPERLVTSLGPSELAAGAVYRSRAMFRCFEVDSRRLDRLPESVGRGVTPLRVSSGTAFRGCFGARGARRLPPASLVALPGRAWSLRLAIVGGRKTRLEM